MATRRTKATFRVEPYSTVQLGPKNLKIRPASAGSLGKAAADARPISTSHGINFAKKIGQHMLKNPGVVDKMIRAAELRSSDTVVEIGPGTGNITVRIVPLAKKVIAIDIDSRMITEVRNRCFQLGYSNLEVVEADALRTTFPKFDVCIANLPYQISTPFIFKLLAHRPLFRYASLSSGPRS